MKKMEKRKTIKRHIRNSDKALYRRKKQAKNKRAKAKILKHIN